jgi:hypothetical protein
MDGYATFTKVGNVRLRRASGRERDAWQLETAPGDAPIDPEAVPLDLLVGERIERMREVWRQTTFFLFDAEGWR